MVGNKNSRGCVSTLSRLQELDALRDHSWRRRIERDADSTAEADYEFDFASPPAAPYAKYKTPLELYDIGDTTVTVRGFPEAIAGATDTNKLAYLGGTARIVASGTATLDTAITSITTSTYIYLKIYHDGTCTLEKVAGAIPAGGDNWEAWPLWFIPCSSSVIVRSDITPLYHIPHITKFF